MNGSVVQWISLGFCLLVLVAGLILSIIGVFSSSWQVSDLKEFQSEHLHGLWLDCVRRRFYDLGYSDSTPTCMYKFDSSAQQAIIDGLNSPTPDAAALEAEHHLFSAWHKAILSLIIIGQFLGVLSIFAAIYSLCYRPAAYVFIITLFICLLLSLIADGVFFISAMRVDVRFVQAVVGNYEQKVGEAFYLHLIGTALFAISFLLGLYSTYRVLSTKYHNSRRTTQTSTTFSSNVRYRPDVPGPPLIDTYSSPLGGRQQPQIKQLSYHVTSA